LLSPEERRTRASIAVKTRFGLDAEPDRRALAELRAKRELNEAVDRLVAARLVQGLSDKVTDPAALAKVAALLVGSAP
jgi:hypothetical protein